MAYEVLSDAKFRVVRDPELPGYHLQVGFGEHYRTFLTMKSGKLDQLRAQARQDEQQASGEQPGA